MSKSTIDAQLRARIDEFVEEISTLVRHSALEAIGDALGAGTTRTTRTTRSAPARKTATSSPKKSGKRIRRSAEDLEKMADTVIAYVKSNAGCRMEEISKALKVDTKDLRKPVYDMVGTGKLKTKGQRRATEYFTSAGRGGAKPKARAKTKAKAKAKKKTRRRAPVLAAA